MGNITNINLNDNIYCENQVIIGDKDKFKEDDSRISTTGVNGKPLVLC